MTDRAHDEAGTPERVFVQLESSSDRATNRAIRLAKSKGYVVGEWMDKAEADCECIARDGHTYGQWACPVHGDGIEPGSAPDGAPTASVWWERGIPGGMQPQTWNGSHGIYRDECCIALVREESVAEEIVRALAATGAGTERPREQDFYLDPNGEWVYRWSDERWVLQAADDSSAAKPTPKPQEGPRVSSYCQGGNHAPCIGVLRDGWACKCPCHMKEDEPVPAFCGVCEGFGHTSERRYIEIAGHEVGITVCPRSSLDVKDMPCGHGPGEFCFRDDCTGTLKAADEPVADHGYAEGFAAGKESAEQDRAYEEATSPETGADDLLTRSGRVKSPTGEAVLLSEEHPIKRGFDAALERQATAVVEAHYRRGVCPTCGGECTEYRPSDGGPTEYRAAFIGLAHDDVGTDWKARAEEWCETTRIQTKRANEAVHLLRSCHNPRACQGNRNRQAQDRAIRAGMKPHEGEVEPCPACDFLSQHGLGVPVTGGDDAR